MIIFGVLLLVGVAVLAVGGWDNFKALFQQNPGGNRRTSLEEPAQGPAPEEILRERYARGELSRDEYLEAQQTLTR
jgi:uncharacterized membrane protein